MIVYGSGISDGNAHAHDDLPILLAGKANGTIKTGRHAALAEGDAADQSLRVDARPDGCEGRWLRRQHRATRGIGRVTHRSDRSLAKPDAFGFGARAGQVRLSSLSPPWR